jgi:hypothetical protein
MPGLGIPESFLTIRVEPIIYAAMSSHVYIQPGFSTTVSFSTDGWGGEERHLDAEQDAVGEANTQNMESTHLHRRTRIKRLVRRMVCFSQTAHLHAVVLGRFINR